MTFINAETEKEPDCYTAMKTLSDKRQVGVRGMQKHQSTKFSESMPSVAVPFSFTDSLMHSAAMC